MLSEDDGSTVVLAAGMCGNGIVAPERDVATIRQRQKLELLHADTTTGSIAGSIVAAAGGGAAMTVEYRRWRRSVSAPDR